MVDTINPSNTNNNTQDPAGSQPGNSFYSGFNRPDAVSVNLVGEHQATPIPPTPPVATPAPQPSPPPPPAPTPAPVTPPAPPKPVYQDVKPAVSPVAPVNPSQGLDGLTNSPQSGVNVAHFDDAIGNKPIPPKQNKGGKGQLLILLGGLVMIIIAGVATYFVAGLIGQNKITAQNEEFKKLEQDLAKLKEIPLALELPVTEVPKSDAPVVQPTVPPVEAPVVQPTPTVTPTPQPATPTPTVQPDGSQSAQG